SPDETLLVTVNPDANTITVFKGLDKPKPSKAAEIAVGHDPVSVTISSANRAFVANAADGTISVVDLLPRHVVETIPVGTEPAAAPAAPYRPPRAAVAWRAPRRPPPGTGAPPGQPPGPPAPRHRPPPPPPPHPARAAVD